MHRGPMKPAPHFIPASNGGGFTLVELLVAMAVIGLLTTATIPVFSSIGGAQNMTQSSSTLATILEQAQAQARAHHTYVWVGILADTNAGTSGLTVAAVESRTGQATDLGTPANIQPIMKPRFMSNLALTDNPSVSGAASGGIDISAPIQGGGTGSSSFQALVGGSVKTFQHVLQFSPNGESILPSASLYPWVNVGIKPFVGNKADVALLQVSGISGEVKISRP